MAVSLHCYNSNVGNHAFFNRDIGTGDFRASIEVMLFKLQIANRIAADGCAVHNPCAYSKRTFNKNPVFAGSHFIPGFIGSVPIKGDVPGCRSSGNKTSLTTK